MREGWDEREGGRREGGRGGMRGKEGGESEGGVG